MQNTVRTLDNSAESLWNSDLAAFAEVVCSHGDHTDFCKDCDEVRLCAQRGDFPALPTGEVRFAIETDRFGNVYGGAVAKRELDDETRAAIPAGDLCTDCWTERALSGACSC